MVLQKPAYAFMKNKINKELRNIYRTEEQTPVPAAVKTGPDEFQYELRRRLLFGLAIFALTITVVTITARLIVKNFIIPPDQPVVENKRSFLSAYELPREEQWALDYRMVVSQAEADAKPGAEEFSTKWLKNTAFHVIMGQQAVRSGNLEEAEYHLGQAHRAFPEMTGIQRDLGTVYLKQNKFSQAKVFLQQAQEQEPSPEILSNLGVAYMGLEQYDLAESAFRQVLQSQPDTPACYKNMAFLYQKTGRTNDAVAAFEKYFELYPKDTDLLESYADYLAQSQRDREALCFLETLKEADPMTVQLLIARAAARSKDAERAVRALREAAKFLTPRRMLTELNNDAFTPVLRDKVLEDLVYQLELAAVVLSTNSAENLPGLSQ